MLSMLSFTAMRTIAADSGGALSFELWTGHEAPLEAMRRAARTAAAT